MRSLIRSLLLGLPLLVCATAQPVLMDKEVLVQGISAAIEAGSIPYVAPPASSAPAPDRLRNTLAAPTMAIYAPWQYTSFTAGWTRWRTVVPRAMRGVQFWVTGRARPAGINLTTPQPEIAGTPFECVANLGVYQEDGTTLIGRYHLTFSGRRLQLVSANEDWGTDPLPLALDEGWVLEWDGFASRAASLGQTLAGEPGRLAAQQPFWPRTEAAGGTLGTWGTCGTRWYNSTNPPFEAIIAAMDAGVFSPPGNQGLNIGGFVPFAITGDPLRGAGAVSVVFLGDSTERSTDFANRFEPWSGGGYFLRASNGRFANFSAALSGQTIRDFLRRDFTRGRDFWIRRASVALVDLGTNDLKDRSVAEVIADFTQLCQELRRDGIEYILAGTQLARWQPDNNTEQFAGFNARCEEFNAWLLGGAGGLVDHTHDRRPAVQDPNNGWRWRPPVVLGTYTTAASSQANQIKLAGTATPDEWNGRHVQIGGVLYQIIVGGSDTLTLHTAVAGGPVPAGQTIEILGCHTTDFTHPGPWGHRAIAAAWPVAKLEEWSLAE